ncbi:MAG: hypothetical protein AAF628_11175 [Planctomycetota bacterium]
MHSDAVVLGASVWGRSLVLTLLAVAAVRDRVPAQDHHAQGHHAQQHHGAPGLWTLGDVLQLEQNRGTRSAAPRSAMPGRRASGQGEFSFEVAVTADSLPEAVKATNPFDGERGRTVLECAHGGFAHDYREGRGEVYWALQGAGILRIGKDRGQIELVATPAEMRELNLHNATFFVHDDQPRIAWAANDGGRVFVTDTEGGLLRTLGRPELEPYAGDAGYAPTDCAYLDGLLWISDGYGSRFVFAYDLDAEAWTGQIFGGRAKVPEPGKFGTNHGLTIHDGLLYVAGRYFARIHSYRPDTSLVDLFPLPEGSKPCDFEFFEQEGKLYGVAASLNPAAGSEDQGASIYIVDMATLNVVSEVKPKDELGLERFSHVHNVFATMDDGKVTLFCQAWNVGDFAILRQL